MPRRPSSSPRWLLPLIVVVAVSGCATRSRDVVPETVSAESFKTWRCETLYDEADQVQRRAADVAYAVDARAGNNIIALSLGVTVFWPALFAMRPDGPEASELAKLKGRYEALQTAATQRPCPPPSDTLAPSIAAQLPLQVGERLVYEERSGARGPAQELQLRLDGLRRDHLEFSLDGTGRRKRWQQDIAGNPVGVRDSGLLHWHRLLRRDLALGDVLAGEIIGPEGGRGRVRGQVVALGVQTSHGRPFDAAVVELFGEVPAGEMSTRLDGVMVVDRKSGVLLRLETRSANPDFSVRRRLVRIEPAS